VFDPDAKTPVVSMSYGDETFPILDESQAKKNYEDKFGRKKDKDGKKLPVSPKQIEEFAKGPIFSMYVTSF
jgi:hypothetical protein